MLEFQIPNISSEKKGDNRTAFTIEPLEKGFGYTYGASLRRVMLSSLTGAAVTSVRIEGVAHEFSTINGVKEDVTDIVLNLQHIAMLEKKTKLEVYLTIGRGRGYSPAEENKRPDQPIGVIPIDSIFSPVKRVAYGVTGARVGQRTDYDRLTLDVETDGSVDPEAALREASEILIKTLAIFTDAERLEELQAGARDGAAAAAGLAGTGAPAGGGGGPMDDILIEELELGVRSYNCLKRAGIQTVGELLQKSESELAAIPNFGRKSIEEVVETLKSRGLDLRQA